jgi:hypothetical protein
LAVAQRPRCGFSRLMALADSRDTPSRQGAQVRANRPPRRDRAPALCRTSYCGCEGVGAGAE